MTGHISKRGHGEGGIDERGENVFRLRYRHNGKRFSKTFHGSIGEARKELRRLVRSGDTGEHVDPSKLTLGQWIDEWITAGAPGRKKAKVGQRTLERYQQLLCTHVKPLLGARRLQQLQALEIDNLYRKLAEAAVIAPRTQHHVHVVLGSCLGTAARKGLLSANPMLRVEQVPSVKESPLAVDADSDEQECDIGEGLTDDELSKMIAGFASAEIYPIVVTAAATGARRNEILALRWTDLDEGKKTLRIERAWEPSKKFGLRLKPPKSQRGLRTIDLDEGTLAVLIKQREGLQRLVAGVPDGSDVDLSLVKLPANCLMFPNPFSDEFSFTRPRIPRSVTQAFARRAETIGFGRIRLHDLRGIHSTALLDAGIPVNRVAERIGDDPATLLRSYTKRRRTKAADKKLSDALTGFAEGFLKPA